MKVFLSWSGSRSKAVAEILRPWLKGVIQALNPWMSSEDIDKGAAWDAEIAANLDAKAGVVCVTPENQSAPWLNFEAGALAKAVGKPMVCTFLIGIKPSEVKGPLGRFQHTEANEEQTLRLLITLNKALGESALAESVLKDAFELWWPRLERELKKVPAPLSSTSPSRTSEDMLEEILLLVRDLTKQGQERAIAEFQAHAMEAQIKAAYDARMTAEDREARLIKRHVTLSAEQARSIRKKVSTLLGDAEGREFETLLLSHNHESVVDSAAHVPDEENRQS